MSDIIIATWEISLDVMCPRCKNHIDLLQIDEFLIAGGFQIGETRTPATRDVEVHCTECGHEFKVDFEF